MGGAAALITDDCVVEKTPPTPDPSPPLRGGRGEEIGFIFGALNSTSVGKNPASVLPAPVGAISSAERCAWAFSSKAS